MYCPKHFLGDIYRHGFGGGARRVGTMNILSLMSSHSYGKVVMVWESFKAVFRHVSTRDFKTSHVSKTECGTATNGTLTELSPTI